MAKRPARKACNVDLVVQSARWDGIEKVNALLRRTVRAAAAELSTGGVELAIVLTDDSAIRLLNRHWRGIDKATNVLSFPTQDAMQDGAQDTAEHACGQPPIIGDIVLAYETIAREARSQGKPFAHHLAHLAVHGFLHLNGYDHEQDDDADTMERLERTILRRLRVPDPYRPIRGTPKKAAKTRAGTR
jgi:probable rRNA maturation factor